MTTLRLHRQRGLTLVELMVAMVLMLLVSVATVALFNVSSNSYRTVDANQQLQDDARFILDVIGKAAQSAGYQDRSGPVGAGGALTDIVFGPTTIQTWRVQGVNNSELVDDASINFGSNNGVNKSDALVIRFFGSTSTSDITKPDGSMIDCSGRAIPYPVNSASVGVSAFFVRVLNGEPELICKSFNPTTNVFADSQIARGVETFQVMYGLDTDNDDVPNQWLSASSAWDAFNAAPSWNNIVAIRVGMVLRGAVGSSQGQSATASDNDLYPLGKPFTGSSTETGLKLTPANDGRLRRAFSATFMLRNTVR